MKINGKIVNRKIAFRFHVEQAFMPDPWKITYLRNQGDAPQLPWEKEKVRLAEKVGDGIAVDYAFNEYWRLGDFRRLVKEGYAECRFKGCARVNGTQRRASSQCRRIYLTEKGRALLPKPTVAEVREPFRGRKLGLQEFAEANSLRLRKSRTPNIRIEEETQ